MLRDSTIDASEISSDLVSDCNSLLQKNNFARVTGLFDATEILEARKRIFDLFDQKNDRKHDPKDSNLLLSNFQKLVVGGTRGANGVPRFLRMFYLPFMDQDIYGMHDIFLRLVKFRNKLYGLNEDFTCFGIEDGMWSACRLNHYPRGGGFMATHVDTGTATLAKDAGLENYVQIILIMSKKGVDFQSGGAYIEMEDGERYFYEDECDVGDIVIYDGRIRHGVEEIDYLDPLDMASYHGRYVAMVTLFKLFGSNVDDEYKKLTSLE
jgi:hypothetical protein